MARLSNMTAGAADGRTARSQVPVAGLARHRVELQLNVFRGSHDRRALEPDSGQGFESSCIGRHEIGEVDVGRPCRRTGEQQLGDLGLTESTGKPQHASIAFLRDADPAVHGAVEVARKRPVSDSDLGCTVALLLAFQRLEPDVRSDRSQHSVSACRNIGDRTDGPGLGLMHLARDAQTADHVRWDGRLIRIRSYPVDSRWTHEVERPIQNTPRRRDMDAR